MKRNCVSLFFVLASSLIVYISCNNPFGTRTPQKPDPSSGGAAIKPANSPENVLYNLRASFESMSVQDYLDIFTGDFIFNPDPDDSLAYEVDFRNGWGFEKEKTFAENFLQKTVTSEIEFSTHTYEYKAGQDMYDYIYSIMVFPSDSIQVQENFKVKGHAWIYIRETEEGKWKIYKWAEIENMIEGAFITWGILRVLNI